ncbi:MAG: hypothetical protein ACYC75_03105 [Minisyncoccota bacterium]
MNFFEKKPSNDKKPEVKPFDVAVDEHGVVIARGETPEEAAKHGLEEQGREAA